MGIAKKFIYSSMWISLFYCLSFIFSFIGNMLFARILMPRDFGLFALAVSINEILFILSGFSFSESIVQIQDDDGIEDVAFILSFGLGLILLSLSIIAAFILNRIYANEVGFLLPIICLAYFINLMSGVYGAILRKRIEFKQFSIVFFVSTVLSVLISVSLARIGFGIWSLAARLALQAVFTFLGYKLFLKWRFVWNINYAKIKKVISFGSKMFLLRGLEMLYNMADKPVIGWISGSSMVGFYYQSRYLSELGNAISIPSFSMVSFSFYSRHQKDKLLLSKMYNAINYFLVRILGLFFLIFALFPVEVVLLTCGSKWLEIAPVLKMLALYAFMVPIFENIKVFLMGSGRILEAARSRLVQVVIFIPLLIVCIIRFGLLGAAYALTASMLAGIVAGLYYVRKTVSLSLREIFLRPLMAAVLTGIIFGILKSGFSLKVPWLMSLLFIITSTISYLSILFILEHTVMLSNIKFVWEKFKEE